MAIDLARTGWIAAICVAVASSTGCAPPLGLQLDPQSIDAGPEGDAPSTGSGDSAVSCTDGCLVGGVCHRAGARSPVNACEVCDPSRSLTAFSPNDGAACDDQLFCTVDDTCHAGACSGGEPRVCDDGVACTAVSECDEATNTCSVGLGLCAAGEACDAATGLCAAGCAGCEIDGTCFAAGARAPFNDCQICDPARSGDSWSANDGVVCDDGLFCTTSDRCGGGVCGGTALVCDDAVACNGAEWCSEVADACVPGATACAEGLTCVVARDVCEAVCAGCGIAGACFAPGARNPTNPCEVCDVELSTSSWSTEDGASCDDGQFCTLNDVCRAGSCVGQPRLCGDGAGCNGDELCDEATNACLPGVVSCVAPAICDASIDSCVMACAGCTIGGACFEAGARNPLNNCEICDESRSRSAWSANDGEACEDGDFCTIADTCSAGLCAPGAARSCDDGVSCNGLSHCDESVNACVAGTGSCRPEETCDVAGDVCVPCTGCVVDGVCFANGARNPASSCLACDAASDPLGWSPLTGARCDDGSGCTQRDVCQAGTCVGEALACSDGVACNGVEVCVEAMGCVAGVGTCGADELCDVEADSCTPACDGCVIGTLCFGFGAMNPANACEMCAPTNLSGWSDNDGETCDDGFACTTDDVCSGGSCGGIASVCDDGIACNGVETCNPENGLCGASSGVCGAGWACDGASNSCRPICDGCTTGVDCVARGTINPDNSCQVCGETGWAGIEAACDDGLACTTADRCAAGTCVGSPVVCSDGVLCNGVESCDTVSGACVPGGFPCADDQICDSVLDVCQAMFAP